jgi:GH24 family phage-related lysozyme (muramidase)
LCPEGNCTQSQRHYTVDAAGVAFIQRHENTVLHTYLDSALRPTIGTGHLLGTNETYPNGISAAEATELFASDMSSIVQAGLDEIKNPSLTQNQVNATGDFIFNEGQTRFDASVLPSLNQGNTANATDHMGRFVKEKKNGKLVTSKGLENRRADELELFNTPQ